MKQLNLILAGTSLFVFVLVGIVAWDQRASAAPLRLPPPANPAFLTGPSDADPLEIALAYWATEAEWLSAESTPLTVTDQYTSRHNGVTHIYLRQQHGGLAILNAVANINIAADGSVINANERFFRGPIGRAPAPEPVLTATAAATRAAEQLGAPVRQPITLLETVRGVSQPHLLSDGGIAREPISAELAYLDTDRGLRLVWHVRIDEAARDHYWDAQVDAETGDLLAYADWVVAEPWQRPADDSTRATRDVTLSAAMPQIQAADAPAYLVFPMPFVDAREAGYTQTLMVDPADPAASPFGWHDIDGAPGAEFTDTRGNNVFAQEDLDRNNRDGFRPNGGPDLQFDAVFDPTLGPQEGDNLSAAIINLFYWNNLLHDTFYAYGFTEAAGNFQENNYGNGGLAGDAVRADAQDGSGFNNASFLAPIDGIPGRMQMYIWTPPPNFAVTAPVDLAGPYDAAGAGFGPSLLDVPASGDLVLADDGSDALVNGDEGAVTDGCQPLVNGDEVAGNILLVDRGNCFFTTKVFNGQQAGAIAVVVANNDGGDVVQPMAGNNSAITIPSVMISENLGESIKDRLPQTTVSVSLTGMDTPYRDSDFENLVIAHEYGHGVSIRLTGGPSNSNCLLNSEQMGEGWSDFIGLMLTAKPGDTPEQTRGVGNYLLFQSPAGDGLRPYPYTTDMTRNPLTYGDLGDLQIPHGTGSVWGAMLWDLYWELIEVYGFDPDLINGGGGNNLTMQLIVDAMKLQTCNPTFVDGRDAILLADEVNYDGANRCSIWRSFAKRGLGVSADARDKAVRFEVEAFDIPVECEFLYSAEPIIDICVGETADYTVAVGASYTPPVALTLSETPSSTTPHLSETSVTTVPATLTLTISDTASAAPGTYAPRLTGTGDHRASDLTLELHIADAAPGVTTLLTPTVDASVTTLAPVFSWTMADQAASYELEIATDSAFDQIVQAATVRQPTATLPQPLDGLQTYFWRVRALNGCAVGEWASGQPFTTWGFNYLPAIGHDG